MSYSVNERLPKDYFKNVMEEKAEMLRKYLRDIGDPLVFSTHIGHNMAAFKFYSHEGEGLPQITFYLLQFGRFTGTIVLLVGAAKLCNKGGNNFYHQLMHHIKKLNRSRITIIFLMYIFIIIEYLTSFLCVKTYVYITITHLILS